MTALDCDLRAVPAVAFDAVVAALARRSAEGKPSEAAALEGSRFEILADRFGLVPAEALTIAMLAAAETDAAVRGVVGARTPADLGRVAGLDPAMLRPTGVLSDWHLLAAAGAGLSLDPRVLDWLRGVPSLDARLLPWCRTLRPAEVVLARHAALGERAAEAMAARPGPMALVGEGPATRARLATDIADGLAMTPLGLDPALFDEAPARRRQLLRLIARETVLDRVLPVLETPALDAALGHAVAQLESPVLVLADRQQASDPGGIEAFRLTPPDAGERLQAWQSALGLPSPEGVAELAEAFQLGADEIAAIAARAGDARLAERADAAWAAARVALAPPADPLVTALDGRAGWDDLVLPGGTIAALRALAAQSRNRTRVYREWGMAGPTSRGLGISALFCGPSGTGKTLAAEVIAGDLGLGLLRVDLAQVVDKYVGETEKHLDRAFALAERSGAVLLFDEAEALFRQRGGGDGAARLFASMTAAYLLQRLERPRRRPAS